MAQKRLMHKRGPYYYGDFRGFIKEGGRKEVLRLPGETLGVTDKRLAEKLYDQRINALLKIRIHQNPMQTAPATLDQHDLKTVGGVIKHRIELLRGTLHPYETRNRERYGEVIQEYLPAATPVRDVNKHLVKHFVVWLRDIARQQRNGNKPYSSATRRHIFNFLRQAMGDAKDADIIEHNPVEIEEGLRPGTHHEETAFYTVEETGKILSALSRNPDGSRPVDWPRGVPDYLFEQVAFALFTGARRNEIQAQRWEGINWDRGRITVHTSKRLRGEDRGQVQLVPREIPLWPQLRTILLAYWRRVGEPKTGLVFPKVRHATKPRKYAPGPIERGGRVDKALHTVLLARKVITGGWRKREPLLFLGRPGYSMGFQEFRVTYCATRLQTIDPVAGREREWVPVARRTVELEMGHASSEMVDRVYGRVSNGPQLRLQAVQYPIKKPKQARIMELVS